MVPVDPVVRKAPPVGVALKAPLDPAGELGRKVFKVL